MEAVFYAKFLIPNFFKNEESEFKRCLVFQFNRVINKQLLINNKFGL